MRLIEILLYRTYSYSLGQFLVSRENFGFIIIQLRNISFLKFSNNSDFFNEQVQ